MSKLIKNQVNEIDHGIEKPLAGDSGVMQKFVEMLRHEQGRSTKERTTRISSNSKRGMIILTGVLALLRAIHWSHWTSHWQVKGSPFYGDHLLFQRLYEDIVEDIDTLAEKIVSYYGSEAVNSIAQINMTKTFLELLPKKGRPIQNGIVLERMLQKVLAQSYDMLKNSDDLTLGLDDYLMALANKHETNVYLIEQRLSNEQNI